jgi:hypothetical protein
VERRGARAEVERNVSDPSLDHRNVRWYPIGLLWHKRGFFVAAAVAVNFFFFERTGTCSAVSKEQEQRPQEPGPSGNIAASKRFSAQLGRRPFIRSSAADASVLFEMGSSSSLSITLHQVLGKGNPCVSSPAGAESSSSLAGQRKSSGPKKPNLHVHDPEWLACV